MKFQELSRDEDKLIVKSGTVLQDLADFANAKGFRSGKNWPGFREPWAELFLEMLVYGQNPSPTVSWFSVLLTDGVIRPPKIITNSVTGAVFLKNRRYDFLELEFKPTPSDPKQLKAGIFGDHQKTFGKYPPGIKCPGSFSKNIVVSELPVQILIKFRRKR